MALTGIEWAELVWNAIVGCTRVSEGCRHCYAEVMAWRHVLMCRALGRRCKYEGTVHLVGGEPRWTGQLNFDEESLDLPLRRKKPSTWFVNSMSDLFHENVRDEWIDRMFAVMGQCPQHRFLVLTKRADRMRDYLLTENRDEIVDEAGIQAFQWCHSNTEGRWPLPNVWLGVSAENQPTADERVPLLLQTPAVVRWVSYEPALAGVGFHGWIGPGGGWCREHDFDGGFCLGGSCHRTKLDWIVVGGESGPGARPCDVAWIRSIVAQCKAAGVPCFVKQLGGQPRGWCSWPHHDESPAKWLDKDGVLPHVSGSPPVDFCHAAEDYWWPCSPKLKDRKGGDPAEWPEDLRVREFPAEKGR